MDDFIDPQIKKRMEQLGKLSSTRHLKLANANDVLTEYYYSPTQRVLTEYENELIGALIDNDPIMMRVGCKRRRNKIEVDDR